MAMSTNAFSREIPSLLVNNETDVDWFDGCSCWSWWDSSNGVDQRLLSKLFSFGFRRKTCCITIDSAFVWTKISPK